MFIQNIYARIYESFISKAKTRVKPNCYTEIHHILPKSLGGTDDISNLVVLTAEEHYKCHLLLCRFTYSIYRHKMLYASKMMINMKRSYQNRFIPNSRIYAWLKEKSAKSSSDLTKGKTYEELYGVEKAKEMRRKKSLPRGPQKPETVQKRAEKLKGLKRTEEQRERMSQSHKEEVENRVYTEEDRKLFADRMSKTHKGIPKSESHKEKLSISLTGKMKGVAKSETTKQNMRKPKSDEHALKIQQAALNRPKHPCPICGLLFSNTNITRHQATH